MSTLTVGKSPSRARKVEGSNYYATPTGLRLGSKGKVFHPSSVYASMSKGEARRLRKRLYKMGEYAKASARRAS